MKVIVKTANKLLLMIIAATVMTVSSTVAFSQTSGDGNKTRQRVVNKGADSNQQDSRINEPTVPADAAAKDLDTTLLAEPAAAKKNVDGSAAAPVVPGDTQANRHEQASEEAAIVPYYEQRHLIAPGLTGWAQIKYPYGASIEDARQKLQYDLYYIKNQSLMLDAIILFETVKIILFGRGR